MAFSVRVFHFFLSERRAPPHLLFNLIHSTQGFLFCCWQSLWRARLALCSQSARERVGESHLGRDPSFLRAQLGHRMETGSLEAAEK